MILLVMVATRSHAASWKTVVGGETQAVATPPTSVVKQQGFFEPEPLKSAEMMTPDEIFPRIPDDRCQWYMDKIGRFVDDCNAVARQEKIPSRLLAVVVLNELADIDMTDVLQDEQLSGTRGDWPSGNDVTS